MANLHSALAYLSPVQFSAIPAKQEDLDPYLAELFTQVQSVVESIPIPDPEPSQGGQPSQGGRTEATCADEMSISSVRSPPPAPEHLALQKEWGKPIKLSAKENPMNMAVYKLGSKDGKGSWFARRSVHEGLGFSRFKRAFEREFPASLAVQGAPGEGNIRGIGAETKVEEITVPNRGKVEVYRLSAQFPGPTTPRDFVTLLITSSKAIKPYAGNQKSPSIAPRHYMIVSKPCDHPDTQPRSGFIRGQYESVEFIREIPRKLKTTQSSTDLSRLTHHRPTSANLEKEVLKHNAERQSFDSENLSNDPLRENKHLSVDTNVSSSQRELSPASRRRSKTVGLNASPGANGDTGEHYDPEDNPVEWIMVTRSDPGGSVPRFMVERGTPSSICADAIKFLDWACQQEDDDDVSERHESRPGTNRRESFASWEANGTLAGIRAYEESLNAAVNTQAASGTATPKPRDQSTEPFPEVSTDVDAVGTESTGNPTTSSSQILAAVSETLNAYTPQIVRDHLPYLRDQTPRESSELASNPIDEDESVLQRNDFNHDDDAMSTLSSTSYASADSHLPFDSDDSPSTSKSLLNQNGESQLLSNHNKELVKLSERKAAVDAKLAQQRERASTQAKQETEKEQLALKKAEEKHAKELKKNEEKYKKEVAKLEARKKKEEKKQEERRRKLEDKDEKAKLLRERDEARAQLDLLKKENDIFQRQIGELQRENTALTARIGKIEGGLGESINARLSTSSIPGSESPPNGIGGARFRAFTLGNEGRNRTSSILNRKKNKDRSDTTTSEASSQVSKGS